jgi:hypothetical protein
MNELSEMDYGAHPPKPMVDRKYLILVPKVDADGNEVAGVRVPEITVPRGTHTGWNLRRRGFGAAELLLLGAYFPFATTKQERLDAGNPRPSLEERYPNNEHYVKAITRAAETLRQHRLLLAEDTERIVQAAATRVDKWSQMERTDTFAMFRTALKKGSTRQSS